jgi:hypothetical protein
MDYTDYAACARAAEIYADDAECLDIAESYRELAKTYHALAEQCERLSRRSACLSQNGDADVRMTA